MVWFYPKPFASSLSRCHLAFNPTMVWFYHTTVTRIACNNPNLSIPLWSDFIKVAFDLGIELSSNFQSHYGLILSLFPRDTYTKCSRLSIPLWSDFILILTILSPLLPLIFQSHYGLILSQASMIRESLKQNFQSHYGLILSLLQRAQTWKRLLSFNPTMVWFYLFYNMLLKECDKNFQSHYGLILS